MGYEFSFLSDRNQFGRIQRGISEDLAIVNYKGNYIFLKLSFFNDLLDYMIPSKVCSSRTNIPLLNRNHKSLVG